jgi:hypothetical protein
MELIKFGQSDSGVYLQDSNLGKVSIFSSLDNVALVLGPWELPRQAGVAIEAPLANALANLIHIPSTRSHTQWYIFVHRYILSFSQWA